MKYRKKPVVIEASQWHQNGDHPQDGSHEVINSEGIRFLTEGAVVRRFRHPEISGNQSCKHCEGVMHNHGWIDTLERGHIVCPGDFIITGIKGERYPCKPEIFKKTYELVE